MKIKIKIHCHRCNTNTLIGYGNGEIVVKPTGEISEILLNDVGLVGGTVCTCSKTLVYSLPAKGQTFITGDLVVEYGTSKTEIYEQRNAGRKRQKAIQDRAIAKRKQRKSKAMGKKRL